MLHFLIDSLLKVSSLVFDKLLSDKLPANYNPPGVFSGYLVFYRFIALAPKTPAKAEATAITTFRITSHTDFFFAIIYLLSVFSYPRGHRGHGVLPGKNSSDASPHDSLAVKLQT